MNLRPDRDPSQSRKGQAVDRVLVRGASLVCLTLLISNTANGTMVHEVSPREVAAYAGFVFAGTVASNQAHRTPATIQSTVTFVDLKFAKGGSKTDTLRLLMAGGELAGEGIVVDGQPTFQVGERYIVFALPDLGSAANSFLPVVGLYQGYFRVVRRKGSPGLVVSSEGMYLADFGPDHLTAIFPDSLVPHEVLEQAVRAGAFGANRRGPHRYVLGSQDPGTRITEEAFLQAVRRFPR